MPPIKLIYERSDKTIKDTTTGLTLQGATLPVIYVRQEPEIQLQIQDGGENYTGYATDAITASVSIDNDFTHYNSANLNQGYSGVVTSIIIKNLSVTPPRTGSIKLINAASETDSVNYTGYSLTNSVYTFTVDDTLDYVYLEDDSVQVAEGLLAKTGNDDVDKTDKDTGFLKFNVDANNYNFVDAVNGLPSISNCKMELKIYSDSELVDVIRFGVQCNNLYDDDDVAPSPINPNDWAISDSRYIKQDVAGTYPQSESIEDDDTFYLDSATGGSSSITGAQLKSLASGEINTGSNVGTGGTSTFEPYFQKTGADLEFRNLTLANGFDYTKSTNGTDSVNVAAITNLGLGITSDGVGLDNTNLQTTATVAEADLMTVNIGGVPYSTAISNLPFTGGGDISVTDGTTTVDPATEVSFTGATVTDGGGGIANITISGTGIGDMTKAVYDPNTVEADVFDSENTVYDNSDSSLDSTNVKSSIDELDEKKVTVQTSWIVPPTLSVNSGDNTKFDISSGLGIVVSYADPSNPVFTQLSYSGASGQTTTYLGTNYATGIMINSSGDIIQTPETTEPKQRRQYAFVGDLLHSNKTNLNGVQNKPIVMWDDTGSLRDFELAVGTINLSGNVYSAYSTDLTIKKTSGIYFRGFANYDVDPENPNHISNAAQTPITSYLRAYRDGAGEWLYDSQSSITPAVYDDGTGTLGSVPANDWTIQRIYNYPTSNLTIIAIGQTVYSTDTAAISGLIDNVEIDSALRDASIRGAIISRGGASDLSDDSDALFFSANKFGEITQQGGASDIPDHNSLTGLNVGDYQHLTAAQKTALTTSVNADSYHSHDIEAITTTDVTGAYAVSDGSNITMIADLTDRANSHALAMAKILDYASCWDYINDGEPDFHFRIGQDLTDFNAKYNKAIGGLIDGYLPMQPATNLSDFSDSLAFRNTTDSTHFFSYRVINKNDLVIYDGISLQLAPYSLGTVGLRVDDGTDDNYFEIYTNANQTSPKQLATYVSYRSAGGSVTTITAPPVPAGTFLRLKLFWLNTSLGFFGRLFNGLGTSEILSTYNASTAGWSATYLRVGVFSNPHTPSDSYLRYTLPINAMKDTFPDSPADSTMDVSVTTLSPSTFEGQDASDQTFTIENSATVGSYMIYNVACDEDWLSVDTEKGMLAMGEDDTITVSYDTDAMTIGSYSADITVSAYDCTDAPVTIGVSLTVAAIELSAGTEKVFASAETNYTSVTALDSTHAIVTYQDGGNSDYGTACCLTLSGTTVSAGTEVAFNEAITDNISVSAMDSTHAIVTYRDQGNSDYGTACCLSLSGTTITAGTEVAFNEAGTTFTSVTKMDSTHAIVAYRDGGNSNYGSSCCLSLSGTTITAGTGVAFNEGRTEHVAITSVDSTHAIVAYQDYANSYYGTACCLSLSGTTITAGTEVVFEESTIDVVSISAMDSTHAIVIYRDFGNSYYGTACCLSLSGTTITAGTAIVFNSGSSEGSSITTTDSTHAIVTYEDGGNSSYGTTCYLSLDGTTITTSVETVFNSGNSNYTSVAAIDSKHAIVTYRDSSNSNYGTAYCIYF